MTISVLSRSPRALVLAGALLLAGASLAHAQELRSPTWGGSGGNTNYNLNCGRNAVMTGMTVRYGSWLDQIGVVCRQVNPDGHLGSEFSRGPVGGRGGSKSSIQRCPHGHVVVSSYGNAGWYINYMSASCRKWDPSGRRPTGDYTAGFRIGNFPLFFTSTDMFDCGSKPAKGLRGKHGIYIDSAQMFCNDWNR